MSYASQSFTITATANGAYDWDAYIDAIQKGTYTKPEIKVVYDFVQVEEFDDKNAETAHTYADENKVGYTTGAEDGWATVGGSSSSGSSSATDTFVMTLQNDGSLSYAFVDVPTGTVKTFILDEKNLAGAVTAGNVYFAEGKFVIKKAAVDNNKLTTGSHTIKVTIGEKEYTLTVTNQ